MIPFKVFIDRARRGPHSPRILPRGNISSIVHSVGAASQRDGWETWAKAQYTHETWLGFLCNCEFPPHLLTCFSGIRSASPPLRIHSGHCLPFAESSGWLITVSTYLHPSLHPVVPNPPPRVWPVSPTLARCCCFNCAVRFYALGSNGSMSFNTGVMSWHEKHLLLYMSHTHRYLCIIQYRLSVHHTASIHLTYTQKSDCVRGMR